jgi:hypothetical protein
MGKKNTNGYGLDFSFGSDRERPCGIFVQRGLAESLTFGNFPYNLARFFDAFDNALFYNKVRISLVSLADQILSVLVNLTLHQTSNRIFLGVTHICKQFH